MAVTLVQSTVTNFNTSNQSTAQTASLTGVTANDALVVSVAMMNAVGASVKSVTTTSGSTSSWTPINFSQNVGNGIDVEWWYATCTSSGSVQVSVLPALSCEFGLFFGELDGGSAGLATGTPVSGMTNVGLSASVQYTAMAASVGSWVAVNSATNFSAETNSTGLGTFNTGPTNSGSHYAGLTYGNANSTTASATGWTASGTRWVTAGIIVPLAGTPITLAASVSSSSSVSGTLTVGSVSAVHPSAASVFAAAYGATTPPVIIAQPTVAHAIATAFGPTNFVGAGIASASAFALSPTNFVQAGNASVAAVAYPPVWAVSGLAGVASVAATAYSLATGSVGVTTTPTTAAATAAAYLAGLPPFQQIPITFLEVAFNNNIFDPLASMVWTNITQYMNKDATITYGRAHNLDGTSAATLEVTLNDRDGRFTPYNISSPYYGNGQTTGLVPSKPVRMYAQYDGINYPVFYGYVSSWTPNVLDQTNQDAVLRASDLLSILGKTYLANTTIYPNLVATSNPIAEFRLGDFTSSYNGTTSASVSDYTGLGGTGTIVIPNISAASIAALGTPLYLGGQTGQFLYDINTQIALGDASTAQNAISQNQQNITSAQQTLASDQTQLASDQAQLATDQATLAADTATAHSNTNTAISDASAAYSAVGTMYSNAQSLETEASNTYNTANSDGHANTITFASFTLSAAGVTVSAAAAADSAAANIIGALSSLNNQGTAAAAANAVKVVNNALTLASTASDDIGQMGYCFQSTQTQANTDGDSNTATDASFSYQSVTSTAQPSGNAATDALQTVLGDVQTAQDAWNTVASDQSQVTQDQGYITKDEALIAQDEATIASLTAAALTTVADTSAYILLKPGSGSILGGVGWFTTQSLPVSGYLNQTIATIATGITIEINTTGFVTLNSGNSVKVTSGTFTNSAGSTTSNVNDGNVHMIAWTFSGSTTSLYLDGVLRGSFSGGSAATQVAVGGSTLLSGSLQGDFIGTVQDFAFFSVPPTASAIAALYVLGSKFQHIETTATRTNDCLLIGLGQSAYSNIPNNVMGNSLCFAEVNQTIQTTALSYIGQVAETENGFFFQNPNATITQLPINWVQTNPTSTTSQGIYADNTSTVFHYGAENFQYPLDDDDLYSSIQIMQSTGTTSITDTGTPTQLNNLGQFIEVTNNTSQTAFGSRTLQQSGILLEYQSDMYFLANLLLARYAFPIPRVQSIQLSSTNISNLPQMLGRQLWERVTVQRQGPGETSFSQDSVIEQITHKIDVTKPIWTTTFCLSPFELIYYP